MLKIKKYNLLLMSVRYESWGEKSSCTLLYRDLGPGGNQDQYDFKN